MSPSDLANPQSGPGLTKQQVKRLRVYFARGAKVHLAQLDGTDPDLIGFGFLTLLDSRGYGAHVGLTNNGLQAVHAARQTEINNESLKDPPARQLRMPAE